MLKAFKLWQLSGALKSRENVSGAYSAVLELSRLDDRRAVDLLMLALARNDGVARSAARELGRLREARAIQPLLAMLEQDVVAQSAADALAKMGAHSVSGLIAALKGDRFRARQWAAWALGEIGDKRAVDPLIEVMQGDNEYAVRTAAATSLGQIKDQRAIWVLVATLKLRDETTPERQTALEELRQATALAMRKIGDPFTAKPASAADATTAALEKLESSMTSAGVHPRLVGDLTLLPSGELTGVLKELVTASEEISWAKLERREPVLAAYFQTYEQRRQAAELVGTELRRRSGGTLLREVLEKDLNHYSAIQNWWSDLGLLQD